MSATTSSRPYPAREGRLPRDLHEVTAPWLTGLLQHRFPGVAVRGMTVVELKNSHTTKLRLALELNEVGVAAGIPTQVCLKSNWSEGFESGDICELEARFYHLMREQLHAPVPGSYFADWDGDGGGRGNVVWETAQEWLPELLKQLPAVRQDADDEDRDSSERSKLC
jgi:hypothetical protein